MEHVVIIIASQGSQYLIYGCLQPMATEIAQDAGSKIFDTLLMPILRMGQGVCQYF